MKKLSRMLRAYDLTIIEGLEGNSRELVLSLGNRRREQVHFVICIKAQRHADHLLYSICCGQKNGEILQFPVLCLLGDLVHGAECYPGKAEILKQFFKILSFKTMVLFF